MSDSMRASETRRPLTAGSEARFLVTTSGADLAKVLRRVLGVNQRKADKVKEIFRQWNADGSGAMSRGEFAEGVKSVQPFIDQADITTSFTSADVDCEGFIV